MPLFEKIPYDSGGKLGIDWIVAKQSTIEKYIHNLEKTVFEPQSKDEQLQLVIDTAADIGNILPVYFDDLVHNRSHNTAQCDEVCSLWIAVVTVIARIHKYKINKEAALLVIVNKAYHDDGGLIGWVVEGAWLGWPSYWKGKEYITQLSGFTTEIVQYTNKFFEYLRGEQIQLYTLDNVVELDKTANNAGVQQTLIKVVQELPVNLQRFILEKVATKAAFMKVTYAHYRFGSAGYVVNVLRMHSLVTDLIDVPPPLPEESPIPQLRDYKRVEQEVKQAEEKVEQAKEELERTKEKLKQHQKDVESLVANTSDIATLYHIWPFNIDNNKAIRSRLKELYKDKIPDDATPWFYEKPVKQYKYLQIRWSRTFEEDREQITEEGEIHVGNANKYKFSNTKDTPSINI